MMIKKFYIYEFIDDDGVDVANSDFQHAKLVNDNSESEADAIIYIQDNAREGYNYVIQAVYIKH